MRIRIIIAWLAFAIRSASGAELPSVVLLGDGAQRYAPAVMRLLQGRANVLVPGPDAGEEWLGSRPAVIHYEAGPRKTDELREAVARLRSTGAAVVFATTPSPSSPQTEEAARAMLESGVTVHDMDALAQALGPGRAGDEVLGEAVADCIVRHLTISAYRPLPVPASGPDASRAYRENESRRDALVPAYYRQIGLGEFAVPQSAAEWKSRRPSVLQAAVVSLGELPPRPSPVRARLICIERRKTFRIEKVRIDNGVEGTVAALVLIPNGIERPAPAILWLHSSTPDHTQIIIPGTNGGEESLGELFVRLGYVVLSPDAYWHGDRAGTGPAGKAEGGRDEQESLFKFHLWLGRTLWGMFVRDDQVALDYLVSRPEVNRLRIGTTGMSMGSTRAWWLAAVDDRITAAAAVACFTRYGNLIAHGQLAQHGVYYFANGLLRDFDSEGVLALIAPRPFLALTGDLDAGSPVDGIRVLEDRVGRTYRALGAPDRFRSIVYPDLGHAYTPAMRAEMIAWFERWLK